MLILLAVPRRTHRQCKTSFCEMVSNFGSTTWTVLTEGSGDKIKARAVQTAVEPRDLEARALPSCNIHSLVYVDPAQFFKPWRRL
jgi:hypothetical protein